MTGQELKIRYDIGSDTNLQKLLSLENPIPAGYWNRIDVLDSNKGFDKDDRFYWAQDNEWHVLKPGDRDYKFGETYEDVLRKYEKFNKLFRTTWKPRLNPPEKGFWARVGVMCPGNFCSLHIYDKDMPGNYTIVNEKQFIDKFFDVQQQTNFWLPHLRTAPVLTPKMDIKELEFWITKAGRNKYEVSLTKARRPRYEYDDVVL